MSISACEAASYDAWDARKAGAADDDEGVRGLAACVDARVDIRLRYASDVPANRWFSAAAADALEVTRCLAPRVVGRPMAPDAEPEQVEQVVTAVAYRLGAG